jgi:hypothetical protein
MNFPIFLQYALYFRALKTNRGAYKWQVTGYKLQGRSRKLKVGSKKKAVVDSQWSVVFSGSRGVTYLFTIYCLLSTDYRPLSHSTTSQWVVLLVYEFLRYNDLLFASELEWEEVLDSIVHCLSSRCCSQTICSTIAHNLLFSLYHLITKVITHSLLRHSLLLAHPFPLREGGNRSARRLASFRSALLGSTPHGFGFCL